QVKTFERDVPRDRQRLRIAWRIQTRDRRWTRVSGAFSRFAKLRRGLAENCRLLRRAAGSSERAQGPWGVARQVRGRETGRPAACTGVKQAMAIWLDAGVQSFGR